MNKKTTSFTRDGVNGSDFVGVFLGECDVFSKKEEPVRSQRGDISPLSFLLLLQTEIWVGFDELMGVKEVTPPTRNVVQFLSWPERAALLLTVWPVERSIMLSCWRLAKPTGFCLGGVAPSETSKLATSPQETGSCRAEHIYNRFNVFRIPESMIWTANWLAHDCFHYSLSQWAPSSLQIPVWFVE